MADNLKAVKEAFTKSQLFSFIADEAEITKRDVANVFEALSVAIEKHVKKRAIGAFTLPGILKIKTVRKPATKARKGINPFTGEPTVFKAKAARTVAKIRPLKKLKEMLEI